jgi:hypothetical protein
MPVKTKQPSEMERRANILEMKASPYALLMSPLITLLLALVAKWRASKPSGKKKTIPMTARYV